MFSSLFGFISLRSYIVCEDVLTRGGEVGTDLACTWSWSMVYAGSLVVDHAHLATVFEHVMHVCQFTVVGDGVSHLVY